MSTPHAARSPNVTRGRTLVGAVMIVFPGLSIADAAVRSISRGDPLLGFLCALTGLIAAVFVWRNARKRGEPFFDLWTIFALSLPVLAVPLGRGRRVVADQGPHPLRTRLAAAIRAVPLPSARKERRRGARPAASDVDQSSRRDALAARSARGGRVVRDDHPDAVGDADRSAAAVTGATRPASACFRAPAPA